MDEKKWRRKKGKKSGVGIGKRRKENEKKKANGALGIMENEEKRESEG